MDDQTDQRTAPLIGFGSRGFCLLSGDPNHHPRRSLSFVGTGGTSVTAARNDSIEYPEQGESSRVSVHPSSSKSILQKSAPVSPKLGSSSSLSSRKTCRMQQNSIPLGQWSSAQNSSAGLAQLRSSSPTCQRGVAYRPGSSYRLGLSETSNLTASERKMNFVFLREAASLSQSNQLLSINSSAEKPDPEALSGRVLDGEHNRSSLDEFNEKRRLSDLVQKNGRHSVQTGIEHEQFSHFGVGSSLYPMATMLINDSDRQLIDLGNRGVETSFDNISVSPVAVDRMAEDLIEPISTSNSDSVFHSSVNQMTQEQESLNRKVADHSDESPVGQVGEVVNVSRSPGFKCKSSISRTANQFASQSCSQDLSAGYGSIDIYKGRSSVEASTSTDRHNASSSRHTLVSDSQQSSFSSYIGHVSENPWNGMPYQTRNTINGQESHSVRRLAEGSLANNTSVAISQRSVLDGPVLLPDHRNLLDRRFPPQAFRRTISSMESNTGCSVELIGGETDLELELPNLSNDTVLRVTNRISMPFSRHRGLNSPSLRGRNSVGALQRRNDTAFGAVNSSGQIATNRYIRRVERNISSESPSRRLVGSLEMENRISRSMESASLYNLLIGDEINNNTSIVSSLPSLRPPPLPSEIHCSRPETLSTDSISLPLTRPAPQETHPLPSLASAHNVNPLSFFDSSMFDRSTPVRGPQERSMRPNSEGVRQRSFRRRSAINENQSGFAMTGFVEVLSALQCIEQNEVLTYEQVLMLEETLLSSGISLHDQHSAMRLDIDNMSYEELLALEERIGYVSTGLSEETISNCLEKSFYTSNTNQASQSMDIEVKCSICQEEYEERDELGSLKCNHSYHEACIKQWLLQKNKCPVCNNSVIS